MPNNYILLGIFTLSQGYIVSYIAAEYEPKIVLLAAFMTAGVVGSVTVYAFFTKTDFTFLAPILYSILFAACFFMVLLLLISLGFMTLRIWVVGLSALGAILFTIFLIVDL